jgi:hypothetical protein
MDRTLGISWEERDSFRTGARSNRGERDEKERVRIHVCALPMCACDVCA